MAYGEVARGRGIEANRREAGETEIHFARQIMSKKATTKSKTNAELRSFYGLVPWRCNHHADRSEIVAYVEASGRWETVAVIPPTSGASAEALATFIARVVNATQQNKDLLRNAMEALEAVVNDGLNFTTEQAAEHVINDIKQVV